MGERRIANKYSEEGSGWGAERSSWSDAEQAILFTPIDSGRGPTRIKVVT
ncbi:unnamed protein product [Brassica napus]|nr:unnamed protein product [Brassica napus]